MCPEIDFVQWLNSFLTNLNVLLKYMTRYTKNDYPPKVYLIYILKLTPFIDKIDDCEPFGLVLPIADFL